MPPNEIQSSMSFMDNFWDTEMIGMDAIFQRMESGHQTLENLQAIYSGRAKVEADQGNHLLVISRTVLADKEETGDILMALRTVSNEIGDNANSHLELAQKIEAEVVQPLRNFSENYIAQVRECQQHLERISESRDEYASRIVEAGDRFNAEQKRLGGDRAARASRIAQEKLRDIHREYQNAIAEFEESVKELHAEWKNSCLSLQDLEEQRLEMLTLNLWEYTNLFSVNLLDQDESFERVRQSLEQCQIQGEIETFISEKGTSQEPPAPLDYLQSYIQRNGKDPKAGSIPEPQVVPLVNKTLPPRPARSSTTAKKTLPKIQTNASKNIQQNPPLPAAPKETLETKVARRMDIRRKPVNNNAMLQKQPENTAGEETERGFETPNPEAASQKQPIESPTIDRACDKSHGIVSASNLNLEGDQWKMPTNTGPQQAQQPGPRYVGQPAVQPVQQHHPMQQQHPSQQQQYAAQQLYSVQQNQQYANHNTQQQYMRSQTLPVNYGSTSPMMAPYAPPSPAATSPWLSPQPHMLQNLPVQNGNFDPPRSPAMGTAQPSPMMAPLSPMMQSKSPLMQGRPVTPVLQQPNIPKPSTLPDGRAVMHWARAKYDYAAQDSTELGFRKGSLVVILGPSADEGWWQAELWDEQLRSSFGQGTVPSNFMQVL
ncbi:formin-binding protein [Umbelopsis sp. WA50703]